VHPEHAELRITTTQDGRGREPMYGIVPRRTTLANEILTCDFVTRPNHREILMEFQSCSVLYRIVRVDGQTGQLDVALVGCS